MNQSNDTPPPDDLKADDLANPRRGESRFTEFLLGAGAFVTALVAVGGGILVLSRDAGPLHAIKAPASVGAATTSAPRVSPPSSTAVGAPRTSATTIFRCEVNGKTVYADVPCSSRNIRSVDVFVNEGFQPTESSTLMTRKLARDEPAPVAGSNESARAERCGSIEEAIRQNEQTARLQQSGPTQDYLTQQRRKLLDEKHELAC